MPWPTHAWSSTSTTTASCTCPNGPEPPNFATVCGPLENFVFTQHAQERANDPSPEQPGGPGWLLTEFGATTDTADLARITADANANLVGWIYWQWINYDDPTGSHSSALWPPRPQTAAQLQVLAETYAVGRRGNADLDDLRPDNRGLRPPLPVRP